MFQPTVSAPGLPASATPVTLHPSPATLHQASGPLAQLGQAVRDELGQELTRFSESLTAASDELLLFGLQHPQRRDELHELIERELEQALASIRSTRAYHQRQRREDLLAALDASDELATFAPVHRSPAVREAADELWADRQRDLEFFAGLEDEGRR